MGNALPNCPLREYRLMSIEERFKLIDDMNDKQVNEVIAYHHQCLQQEITLRLT